jgi:integrase
VAITVRKNRRTGVIVGYQVQIRLPGEKSKSRTLPTYEQAEKYEQEMANAIKSSRSKKANRQAFAKAAKPGLAALSSELLADTLTEFKRTNPDHRFGQHVASMLPSLAGARFCDLSDDWCKKWCKTLRKQSNGRGATLSDGTLAHYIKILRFVCKWKAEAMGIECPKTWLTYKHLEAGWDDGRDRRLMGDEEARLRNALGQLGCRSSRAKNAQHGQLTKPSHKARQYQLLFDLAIETCAREAELVELPWSEVDLVNGIWRLAANRTKKKWKRVIVFTPRAIAVLRELAADRKHSSPRVFHRLPTAKAVGQTFRRIRDGLGIDNLTWHDLRHEGITKLRLSGAIDPGALMQMVGHKSAKMAMRYFNPLPEEIRARMWAVLAPNQKQPGDPSAV